MSYPEPERSVESLPPADLRRRLAAGEAVHLLDVRNRGEIDEWRIAAPERTEVPYVQFQAAAVRDALPDAVDDALDADEQVVVVCAEGKASAYVAGLLVDAGYDAVNLDGGMEGWARLYEAREVSADPLVLQYDRPSSGCLAYLVASGGQAAVVDPLRAFADRYVADAEGRGARDHGVTPVMTEPAADRGLTDRDAFHLLADGDALAVGDAAIEAVHAPGHTTGMTAYRVGDCLLTGDGLFTRHVPRPDLQEGADGAAEYARELHRTLTERFARFDDDLLVCPGHYDPDGSESGPHTARLGDLRERLPAFEQSADEFVDGVLGSMGARPANFEEIIAVNLGEREADDEAAFELELGPNNCAASRDALTH